MNIKINSFIEFFLEESYKYIKEENHRAIAFALYIKVNMKKPIGDTEGDILHCDTLSTESPSNSFASISPLNGDDKEENKWISNQPGSRIDRGRNNENESHKQSLNDGVILSHLQIDEIISKRRNKRDDMLLAPSTIEERQNEKYARKVGIHL